MRVRVQVVIETDDGSPAAVHEVVQLDRDTARIDTLGWSCPASVAQAQT